MGWRSDDASWGWVTKTFHWLIALAIIGMLVVGWWMHDLPNSPDKIKVYALHKSFGITILALMTLRLAWRLLVDRHRPALPPGMPRWQRIGADVSHVMLYVLVFAQTFSGWLFNSAANFPLRWFGLFSVPRLTGPDKDLRALAGEAHEIVAYLLVGFAVLHIVAAWKHHLVDRDVTLVRMLPFRTARETLAKPHANLPPAVAGSQGPSGELASPDAIEASANPVATDPGVKS